MKKVIIINGPNINKLGVRDRNIYGNINYDELLNRISTKGQELGLDVDTYQSNSEGEIIDQIQSLEDTYDGLIINPGAYTHYSYAIRDALDDLNIPKIEVHISNINAREEFRQKSVTAPVVDGQIVGFGIEGYYVAIYAIKLKLS